MKPICKPAFILNSPCIQTCNTVIYVFNIRITIWMLHVACWMLISVGGLNNSGVGGWGGLENVLKKKITWGRRLLGIREKIPNPLNPKSLEVRRIRSTRIHHFTTRIVDLCWYISTSSHVSNCDGIVLEISLYHKF